MQSKWGRVTSFKYGIFPLYQLPFWLAFDHAVKGYPQIEASLSVSLFQTGKFKGVSLCGYPLSWVRQFDLPCALRFEAAEFSALLFNQYLTFAKLNFDACLLIKSLRLQNALLRFAFKSIG